MSSAILKTHKLAFLGGGNMTGAVVMGLLKTNFPPENISISEPYEPRRVQLNDIFKGVRISPFNHEAAKEAETVVLAVKPTVARSVLVDDKLASVMKRDVSLMISIAAGIRIPTFKNWVSSGKLSIVRCMPNTPSLLGMGAIGMYASKSTPKHHITLSEAIMGSVSVPGGGLVWVDEEDHLDAVTAVSGSGPAYHFYLTELIEQEGIRLGLDQVTSRKLAAYTALGSANMLVNQCLASPENPNVSTPEELRNRVTSHNGTTHAAIMSFQKDNLPQVVQNALEACRSRAKEIGDELDKQ